MNPASPDRLARSQELPDLFTENRRHESETDGAKRASYRSRDLVFGIFYPRSVSPTKEPPLQQSPEQVFSDDTHGTTEVADVNDFCHKYSGNASIAAVIHLLLCYSRWPLYEA